MKKVIGIIAIVAVVVIVIITNNRQATKDIASNTVQEFRNDAQENGTLGENTELENAQYAIVTEDSTLGWKGGSAIRSHNGTIDISNGSMDVQDGSVIGNVVLDMNTVDSESNAGLDNHLKSDDFFDVAQYPTATIAINGFSNNNLDVDLTIKDTTLNILVPAVVNQDTNTLNVVGATVIDRTLWDIRYNSNSFFANLGDSAIDDEFEINFDLVAEVING